jgi:di/tricarboxylate transporter
VLAPHNELNGVDGATALVNSQTGVAELVIPPRSGRSACQCFQAWWRAQRRPVVLAVQRRGEDLGPAETPLAAGDTLLVQGTWDALEANGEDDADVLVVESPEAVRRQAVPMGPGSGRAIAVLVGMVILLATGIVPPAVGSLLAACALVLLGVVTVNQAYRSISWTTIVLIAGMIPLSHALQQTGAAEQMAQGLVLLVGDRGPYVLLLGLILLTAVLGQLISNTATALVVIPIALSAAYQWQGK